MKTHTQIAFTLKAHLLKCYRTAVIAAKKCDDLDQVHSIWERMNEMAQRTCNFLSAQMRGRMPMSFIKSLTDCQIIAARSRKLAEWHS